MNRVTWNGQGLGLKVGDLVRCKIYRADRHELLEPLPVGRVSEILKTSARTGLPDYVEVVIFDRRLRDRFWRLFARELILVPSAHSPMLASKELTGLEPMLSQEKG